MARANFFTENMLEQCGMAGMSVQGGAQELARKIASSIDVPILVDGDGITALVSCLSVPTFSFFAKYVERLVHLCFAEMFVVWLSSFFFTKIFVKAFRYSFCRSFDVHSCQCRCFRPAWLLLHMS